MSAPNGQDWMLQQSMGMAEFDQFFSGQRSNSGEKLRPGSPGQTSRPGTSDSSHPNSSLGSLFANCVPADLDSLPMPAVPEDQEDQNLFSLPVGDFGFAPTTEGSPSTIDPALLGVQGMDFQMQDQAQFQETPLYPDPTDDVIWQPYDGVKNLPQPYGMMNQTDDFAAGWPSPPAANDVQEFNLHQLNQQSSTPLFVQQNFTQPQELHLPPIEPKDAYTQSADQTLDFGDEEDKEYQAPNKRRKTGTTTTKIVKKYNAEAPRKNPAKTWLRQNYSTKGNTRTGKLNNFGNGEYAPRTEHPLGMTKWSSATNRFAYNEWGELHGVCFPAAQIQDFLYSHPYNRPNYTGQGKLILWIQKMAGDMQRRSETQNSFSCRAKECPTNIYKKRTIATGHYRVAFDEQWDVYGDHRNPLICAGYVHLYCMERFFDFRRICHDFDVRADDREIEREPTGCWTTGLGQNTDEFHAANSFIKFAKQGKNLKAWADYPQHDPTHPKRQKLPHSASLTHKIYQAKTDSTGASKMRMMLGRERSATQFFVNMGDLQMQVDTQQEKARLRRGSTAAKRKRGKKAYDSDEDLSSDEEVPADNTEVQVAPVVNMNSRKTRASTRISSVEPTNVGPTVTKPAPAPQSFAFPNEQTTVDPFANEQGPLVSQGAERPASLSSLFCGEDEMQISPKRVPEDMVDPALSDKKVEPAAKEQGAKRKASDEINGVDSMGFFAIRRK